jgi:hypothetical protein
MAESVSKDFSNEQLGTPEDQLFWPEKANNIDRLKINIVEFVPISKSGLGATKGLSNVQGQTAVFDTPGGPGREKKTFNTILLPVPEGVTYTDSPSWNEMGIGAMGKLAGQLAGDAANGADIGPTLTKMAQGGMAPLLLNQISKVSGLTSLAESITQSAGGVALNPYTEQIFKGISMRNFSYSWKLVPRNEREQIKINNIIKALRFYSLPNYTSSAGLQEDPNSPTELTGLSDRWLTVPKIFQLSWVYGSDTQIKSLPKIKPCVLKGVTVNYTPDGVWATHRTSQLGPAPVSYNLSLEFSETEIITGKDVRVGGY